MGVWLWLGLWLGRDGAGAWELRIINEKTTTDPWMELAAGGGDEVGEAYDGDSGSQQTNWAATAGGIAGGLALVALVAVAVVIVIRNRKVGRDARAAETQRLDSVKSGRSQSPPDVAERGLAEGPA